MLEIAAGDSSPNLSNWNCTGQPGTKVMTCISAHCTSSKFYFQPDLFSSTFVFAEASFTHNQCTLQGLHSFSSSRCWSCCVPKMNSKISYQSHNQQCQPCCHCPLQKRHRCTLGTMHTWAGTITSSNCWHWIHSVLKGGKNNLYEPNTQLQVKLQALTD